MKKSPPKNQLILNYWRAQADWHNRYNPDSEAANYATDGILPKELKRAMNYPSKHMPQGKKLVVNDFYHITSKTEFTLPVFISPSVVVTADVEINITNIIKKLNNNNQWPFPGPDLKGVTNADID